MRRGQSLVALVPRNPIKHIVGVIQENRSFDSVFHHFAEPDGTKADTVDAFEDLRGGPSHGPRIVLRRPPRIADQARRYHQSSLSFRVPLIVVSPYAKHGYVSPCNTNSAACSSSWKSTQYRVAECYRRRSDDLRDMFDYTRPPPSFKTIATSPTTEDPTSER